MESFVEDGPERAEKAIRAQVQAKYAEQLTCAKWSERRVLKRKMKAEIREAIQRLAPPSALY
jgi:hypothetical protein